MNKAFYFFAGVLSTILIVSVFSLVSAKWFWEKDNAQLGPSLIINSHECRADGICETINLKASDSVGAQGNVLARNVFVKHTGPSIGFIETDLPGEAPWNIASMNGSLIFTRDRYQRINKFEISQEGAIKIGESQQQVIIDPGVEQAIRVTTYAGNGTAYACISAQGGIFRSQTPCR